MRAENASSTQRLSRPSCTARSRAARPTIPASATRTTRRSLRIPASEPLFDPVRHECRACRAERLPERDRAELVRLADDRLTFGARLTARDEQRCTGDFAPRDDSLETPPRVFACILGEPRPST